MPTGQMSEVLRRLCDSVRARDGAGLSDSQLLQSFIARRDEVAFEALVRRHGPMVLAVCRRVTGNEQDAEDSFQATFFVLVRKAGSLGSAELVGNWLYGVAYRTALKARTASARRQAQEKQVRLMPELKTEAEDIWLDLQPLLDRELNRLPDKYRVPVVLCELEGRTRKEVARRLRIPEGTLSSRLATARKMLAKRLARQGLAISGSTIGFALTQKSATACLPTSLINSTVKAAALIATGQLIAKGIVSSQVAALTEGVLKAMFLTKLKVAVGVILAIGMIGLGTGLLARPTLAAFMEADSQPPQALPQDRDKEKNQWLSPPAVKVPNTPKTDKDRIQGTWAVVAAEFDGQDVTERVGGITAIFKGGRVDFSTKFLTGDVSITFQLDPTKNPKAIDFTLKSSALAETMKGIYEIKDDTLRFCVPIQKPKDQQRPQELKTAANSSLCLFVMKRQKDEAGKPSEESKLAPKGAEVKKAEIKGSPKSERIIFWLNRNRRASNGELATIGLDGKGFALSPRGKNNGFHISPDGRQIAYGVYDWSRADNAQSIFVVDLASEPSLIGQAARLAGADFQEGDSLGIHAHAFCWSPDGANLAYSLLKDRKTMTVEHGIINVRTKEQKELLLPPGHRVLDWSPDGQCFLTGKSEYKESDEEYVEHHVYLVKRNGSVVRQLDEAKGRAWHARFSPDGNKVLFLGWEDHKITGFRPSRVFVADLLAGKGRPVSPELNAFVEAACWSPDGKGIAYAWRRLTADAKFEDETEHILSVVDANGGNSATLWTEQAGLGQHVLGSLEWHPASAVFIEGLQNASKSADAPKTASKPPAKADGIVFLLNEELAMIHPDGKGFTRLPTKAKHIFFFHVSPDGKGLAYTAHYKNKFRTYVTDLFAESSIIANISRLAGNDLPEGDVLDGDADYCRWSADGTKLLCGAGDVRKGTRQWIVDMKTGEKTELQFPEGHWLQDWSSDGNWFLTLKQDKPAEDKFTPRVYLVNKDGSEVRRLSNDNQLAWPARFSPDGRRALFVAWDANKNGRHPSRVQVVDLPDGKPQPVSPELNAVVYSACWSPGGKRISYIWHQVRANPDSDDPVEYVLSLIDADGKNPLTLRTEKGRLGPSVHVDWR